MSRGVLAIEISAAEQFPDTEQEEDEVTSKFRCEGARARNCAILRSMRPTDVFSSYGISTGEGEMIQIDRLLFIAVLVSAFAAAALAGVPGTIFAFGVSRMGAVRPPNSWLTRAEDSTGRPLREVIPLPEPASSSRSTKAVLSTLHKFGTVPNDGLYPQGALTLVGGKLYGTTSAGGEGAGGALFSLNVDGSQYQILHSFGFRGGDGAKPQTGLTLFDGALWGTTSAGGRGQGGTVYSILPDGGAYTVIFNFIPGSLIGSQPEIAVTFLGGQCFGVTSAGGADGDGSIFSLLPDGSQAAALHSFDRSSPANGYFPNGPLASGNGVLYGVTDGGGPFGPGIVYAIRADGSDFRIVHSFGSGQHTDGSEPAGSLLVVGGVIYGTTAFGGANDQGTHIRSRTEEISRSFTRSRQTLSTVRFPHSGLAVVSGGLAGTTLGGGVTHLGTAFSIQPDGSGYKQVFSFGAVNHDGWYPASGVIDVGGKLYGTTSSGGLTGAWGTVYSINKDGSGEQLLHEFDFDTGDGVFQARSWRLVASSSVVHSRGVPSLRNYIQHQYRRVRLQNAPQFRWSTNGWVGRICSGSYRRCALRRQSLGIQWRCRNRFFNQARRQRLSNPARLRGLSGRRGSAQTRERQWRLVWSHGVRGRRGQGDGLLDSRRRQRLSEDLRFSWSNIPAPGL